MGKLRGVVMIFTPCARAQQGYVECLVLSVSLFVTPGARAPRGRVANFFFRKVGYCE